MEQKAVLLRILASDECPICHRKKEQFLWTCSPCYKPHEWAPEQDRLSKTCDEHMRAADAFLNLARVGQKPVNE